MLAALAGGTGAFFTDREVARGNILTAGAIDLQIDNTSYYNGVANPGSTWQMSNLTDQLFFNFNDLKPDDEGEDTISLHVGTNDAWACMNISLTKNDDMDCTEPEGDAGADPTCIANDTNTDDGELAGLLEFLFWNDDGDNVFEDNETVFKRGTADSLFDGARWTLADAASSIDTVNGGPLDGNETYYLGKAWCFGDLTPAPLAAGTGIDPTVASGVTCEGTGIGNAAQTDQVMVDVMFEAVQARHNPGFLCIPDQTPDTGMITVTKSVITNDGGNESTGDFQLKVDSQNVTSGVAVQVSAGTHVVSEDGVSGYEATFGGDCDADGNVNVPANGSATCTLINDDIRPNITLFKSVNNDSGGTALPSDFTLRVNGISTPSGSSRSVSANAPATINEDAKAGYSFVSITGSPECPGVLGGTATLDEGEAITCTITNDDN